MVSEAPFNIPCCSLETSLDIYDELEEASMSAEYPVRFLHFSQSSGARLARNPLQENTGLDLKPCRPRTT